MTLPEREALAQAVETSAKTCLADASIAREHNQPDVEVIASIQADKLLAAAAELRKTCKWTNSDDGPWETGCGHAYEFIDDGPKENGQQFCGYCGGRLVEVRDDAQ